MEQYVLSNRTSVSGPPFNEGGVNTQTPSSVLASAAKRAAANAAAQALGKPLYEHLHAVDDWTLPVPLGNVVGGGAHSLGPAPDMQEHLVVPVGAKTVREAIEVNLAVHAEAGRILERKGRGFAGGMDDEDAWAADLTDFEAFEVVEQAKKTIEDRTGVEIRIGTDLAADRLYDKEKDVYVYDREGASRTRAEQLDFVLGLIDRFDKLVVADGHDQIIRGAEAHEADRFAQARMAADHDHRRRVGQPAPAREQVARVQPGRGQVAEQHARRRAGEAGAAAGLLHARQVGGRRDRGPVAAVFEHARNVAGQGVVRGDNQRRYSFVCVHDDRAFCRGASEGSATAGSS